MHLIANKSYGQKVRCKDNLKRLVDYTTPAPTSSRLSSLSSHRGRNMSNSSSHIHCKFSPLKFCLTVLTRLMQSQYFHVVIDFLRGCLGLSMHDWPSMLSFRFEKTPIHICSFIIDLLPLNLLLIFSFLVLSKRFRTFYVYSAV